jgi:hypothetical protein
MDFKQNKSQSLELPGLFQFDPAWIEIKARHSLWVRSRLRESDVIYRLPACVLPTLQLNLGLSADDLSAETQFDELFLRFRAVAVCNDRPILYRWLLPPLSPFPKEQLEGMLKLGWTAEQIRKVPRTVQFADDISMRVQSIAGRRICNPEFLAERDRLRIEWLALPDNHRRQLPLLRTLKLSQCVDWLEAKAAPKALAAFLRMFDDFCTKWHLLGMPTWDLPDPVGPMWPEMISKAQSDSDDSLVLRSPYDFPILDSDGVGPVAREQHEQAAKSRGITDLKRWQTYARLLEIDHWERVLTMRYRDYKRPRNWINFLEATIGELMDRDAERIQKHRKQMRALKHGKRKTLSNHR